MTYAEFLKTKEARHDAIGPTNPEVSEVLFPFQRAITRWAIRKGRACVFADCGLGKTLMQLEWARHMPGPNLIVAPLGVTHQTVAEADKLGIDVSYVTEPTSDRFQITNYDRLSSFTPDAYQSLVLDESSILKSVGGKIKRRILKEFTSIPYRLACTATPAPNDIAEMGNHAEFVGAMTWSEMSAAFFVKESNSMHWRLKGHAASAFYEWLASWACYIRYPSDIGFEDDGFVLPHLTITEDVVESAAPLGQLFPTTPHGIQGRLSARRASLDARVRLASEVVNDGADQWVVWCGLNRESDMATESIDGAEQVSGSTSLDDRLAILDRWRRGETRVLVTKPSVFGFGMNFQHCSNMLFLGLGDSYEQYYQAIRRCWRFGQDRPVVCRIVISESEGVIAENVRRKEAESMTVASEVISRMRSFETAEIQGGHVVRRQYETDTATGDRWTMCLGDSVEVMPKVLDDDSVGLSVFSPPFVSLYTYSDTSRDLGNSRSTEQFLEHFRFIAADLLRATMPGRVSCVHVSQVPAMLVRDGYIGMKDFRAETVRLFESCGWIYHGEVVIDKDPQAQAIRTKSKGLLFATLKRDASWLRPALADYILVFRKPGDNPSPIAPDISHDDWISWARPIWYGIRETHTLNYRVAREDKDERHICPLQLDVIERCVRLWSNPGDLVFSPFAGIGSEGYVSVRQRRQFVGIELKPQYWAHARKNLDDATKQTRDLFGTGVFR